MTFEQYWAVADMPKGLIGNPNGPIGQAFLNVAQEAFKAGIESTKKQHRVWLASLSQPLLMVYLNNLKV